MSYIYFIECRGAHTIKIGYTSSNPLSRLSSMQTGCPYELRLLFYVEGTLSEEKALHELFAPLLLRGEWFSDELKLADLTGWCVADVPFGSLIPRPSFMEALRHTIWNKKPAYPGDNEALYGMSADIDVLVGNWPEAVMP